MLRFLLPLLFSVLFFTSCRGGSRAADSSVQQDSIPQPQFQVLDFEADGTINSASIDTRYKNFTHKDEFPISLFITINGKDKAILDALEKKIVESLHAVGTTAFLGHVTMPTFRDVIFYIKKEDQQAVNKSLSSIKEQNPAIKEFVFEEDNQWEAVDEFFQAMK